MGEDRPDYEGQRLVDRLIGPLLDEPEHKIGIIAAAHGDQTFLAASSHMPAGGQYLDPNAMNETKHLIAHIMKTLNTMIEQVAQNEGSSIGLVFRDLNQIMSTMSERANDPIDESYTMVKTIKTEKPSE